MDEKLVEMLAASFAGDLFETIKAARKFRDEKVFRHTMLENEDGMMVFCGLFPKADVAQFPGVNSLYLEQLETFNMMGIITDGQTKLDFFHLGGMNKPLTSLKNPNQLTDLLRREQLISFLQQYFRLRNMLVDLSRCSYEEFLQIAKAEVDAHTSFKEFSTIEKILMQSH